jgi:putative ABC transport system substrate-binding protein
MQSGQLRRRELITLLGGAAVACPLRGHAQQSSKLPTIGFLGPSTPEAGSERMAVFEERLQELGWVRNRNVFINYQWADGNAERFKEIAAEFVRERVAVIATYGTATAIAAKDATSVIPIVFTIVSDPVGSGLVTSLARPSGNVTGLSTEQVDIAGKRLEMLRELLPYLNRVAVLANATNLGTIREMDEAQRAAKQLGLQVVALTVRNREDLAHAIELAGHESQALFITSDAFLNNNRVFINKTAIDARIPTIYGYRGPTQSGGLISYGPNYADLLRRAADYVDKILRGTKPADLPIEQPTKFELVINLKTARALGITVPPTLLARADDVIE